MQTVKAILFLAFCLARINAQQQTAATFTTLGAAVEAAADAPNLSILLAAVQAANVTSALGPNTTWTILAPTNDAFTTRLNASLGITPEQLLLPENRETLVNVLSYHVIPSAAVLSSQLTDGMEVATALTGADPLTVSIKNGTVTFVGGNSNATVTVADIKAGSSVIHVIDDVLLPAGVGKPEVAATAEDGPASNTTFTSLAAAVAAANASAPNLSILLAAVQAAGVGSALTPNTTWTILAPTNEAFEKLNKLGIAPTDLLLPKNKDTLVTVLSYHVIPGAAVLSSQLTDGMKVATALEGADPLTVSIKNGSVTFVGANSNATVTVADIKAGSSVIHVIDNVLLPEGVGAAAANATANTTKPNVTSAQGPPAPAASPRPGTTSGAMRVSGSSLFWATAMLAGVAAML